MISISFNSPPLEEEFKDHGFSIELSDSIPLNCVARMDVDTYGFLLIKVSHVFRLLQLPVQEFIIYQFIYYTEFKKLGVVDVEAWEDADEKSFIKTTEKYGNVCAASIIYASNIFTPLMNHGKSRLKNLLLLYEATKTFNNE